MKRISIIIILIGILQVSCDKEFLAKKPDKSLLVPKTLAEFEALMDNLGVMNITPALSIVASDELSATDNGRALWTTAPERNSYIWASDLYEGAANPDWTRPYQQIFYANIVLDGLKEEASGNKDSEEWKRIKGAALFFRAHAIWQLAQLFAEPYDKSRAAQDPGIPYPLISDINNRPGRQTVQQTYERMLSDLLEAEAILPVQVALKSRPSKPAALAMLARVYLSMNDYVKAGHYADLCLQINNKLLDFNTISTTSNSPFPATLPYGNDEALFHSVLISYSFLNSSTTGIDQDLYKLYSDNDLRKALYFLIRSGVVRRKGSYAGTAGTFSGLATDEVYLIRAECFVRQNNVTAGLQDLNSLLITRWKKGTFIPYTAASAGEALRKILEERNKELLSRGLRWSDLRRLNKDPNLALTLTRTVANTNYTLLPGDRRYTFSIPDAEVLLSGIEQNPR